MGQYAHVNQPGKTFTVRAKNNSPENRYIQWASLNGQHFTRTWIGRQVITAGGLLEFERVPKSNENWSSGKGNTPPRRF